MNAMTSHERYKRMFEHREADRVPVIDGPWGATVERWHREGMPSDVDYVDFFGLDRITTIGGDVSPRYEAKVLEETEEYSITTTSYGVTMKNWRHAGGTPEFLDFTIVDRDSWNAAKARMAPTRDRVDWTWLQKNYRVSRERGDWIAGGLWFGFDVTHSWIVGTERVLMALLVDSEWLIDIFNHMLDVNLALLDQIWAEGYTFDAITWPDDMGFKHNQFFSLDTYRNVVKPVHKRAADWAHAKGIRVQLHSCGDVNPFVSEFIEIGIDCLNPLEVKAGMDPIALKEQFGDRLVLHGGVNAVLYDDVDAITEEMKRVIPVLKEGGGYIFSSDHSVPSSVSLTNFRHIVELAKQLGRY